ncbi:MAG: shikimate dehydrogenase [Glaciecola sp.]|jgi:shikimate dehydrogenase
MYPLHINTIFKVSVNVPENFTSTKKLAVFGAPIAQSKSPIIHQMFAQQFDLNITYERILGEPAIFTQQLNDFFADPNAVGANITMPFKEDAANWASEKSSGVSKANAANTLIRLKQGFRAETTDGKGLVSDLLRNQIHLQNKVILVIGAGGAARGAMEALLAEQPQQIYITNRSKENAHRLVEVANDQRVQALSESECEDMVFDVIINATSLSLNGQLPALSDKIFHPHPSVYDMVYQDVDTCFVAKAKSLGCTQAIDGLGMLVGQAAESFYLWFGLRPDVTPVLEYLRQELKDSVN